MQLWDASTGQGLTKFIEHQKRAWSVDFSQVDPNKLASGGDDFSVKLWSTNEVRSSKQSNKSNFSSFSIKRGFQANIINEGRGNYALINKYH